MGARIPRSDGPGDRKMDHEAKEAEAELEGELQEVEESDLTLRTSGLRGPSSRISARTAHSVCV